MFDRLRLPDIAGKASFKGRSRRLVPRYRFSLATWRHDQSLTFSGTAISRKRTTDPRRRIAGNGAHGARPPQRFNEIQRTVSTMTTAHTSAM